MRAGFVTITALALATAGCGTSKSPATYDSPTAALTSTSTPRTPRSEEALAAEVRRQLLDDFGVTQFSDTCSDPSPDNWTCVISKIDASSGAVTVHLQVNNTPENTQLAEQAASAIYGLVGTNQPDLDVIQIQDLSGYPLVTKERPAHLPAVAAPPHPSR